MELDEDERASFRACIRAMDSAYFKYLAAKQSGEVNQTRTTPMTPGIFDAMFASRKPKGMKSGRRGPRHR